jgi:hypothetical protein
MGDAVGSSVEVALPSLRVEGIGRQVVDDPRVGEGIDPRHDSAGRIWEVLSLLSIPYALRVGESIKMISSPVLVTFETGALAVFT